MVYRLFESIRENHLPKLELVIMFPTSFHQINIVDLMKTGWEFTDQG